MFFTAYSNNIYMSLVNCINAIPFASDKAKALTNVLAQLGYAREDSYAFGDGINDITMMKAAGHGIAMGNGQERTKEAAEYVTAPIDEDGVWLALKHCRLI